MRTREDYEQDLRDARDIARAFKETRTESERSIAFAMANGIIQTNILLDIRDLLSQEKEVTDEELEPSNRKEV